MKAGLLAALLAATAAASPAPELAWRDAMEIAAGGGQRGPWRQNESRYHYVDDPSIAIDERGELAVAWVDQARKDVFFQRIPAQGAPPLGGPVNVSRNPATFSWLPRVAIAPDDAGHVFLLWQEIIFSGGSHGGDILFARSVDGGARFSRPLNLSRSVGGDGKGRISRDVWHNGSLDLVAGKDGALYAAWTEYDGPLWLSRSTNRGESFSTPRRMDVRHAEPARAPSLALAPDGTLYLAWTLGEDPAADVRVARSTDRGGSFTAPRIVARSKKYSDAPKLAVDARGSVHLVYGDGSQIHYTRSIDGGRRFAPPRNLSRGHAGFPSLALDAKGRVYVLWELFETGRPRGLALAVSYDGGDNFTAPGVVPGSWDAAGGSNGSQQGLLMKKLAVNGAGEVAIVNSSFREGTASRVWLIRASLPLRRPAAGG